MSSSEHPGAGWEHALPSQVSQDALIATQCPDCQNQWEAPPPDATWSHSFCPQCRFPLELLVGKYRLIRRLGSGSFGDVYLAAHNQLAQAPARVVKVLKPTMFEKPEARLRFQREIQLTSILSLQNEHIVHIFDDFGEDPKLGWFYVMEFLDGQPLQALLTNDNLPSLALCHHIMAQLCDGIAAAHRENIIHRDLKPDNIFLVKRHEDPHFVKVLDFGIAKPLRPSADSAGALTGINRVLGTPHYMSPEQCLQGTVDARSDIYAMGVILYEMLVGHTPFAHHVDGGLPTLLRAHIQEPPPLPTTRQPNRGIPQALEDVVLQALAKDPAERFASAQAFKAALAVACTPVHGEHLWQNIPTDPYAHIPTRPETASLAPHTPPPLLLPRQARGTEALTPIDPANALPDLAEEYAATAAERPAWRRKTPTRRRWGRGALLLGFGVGCGMLATWAWLSLTVWPWWDATTTPQDEPTPLRMGQISQKADASTRARARGQRPAPNLRRQTPDATVLSEPLGPRLPLRHTAPDAKPQNTTPPRPRILVTPRPQVVALPRRRPHAQAPAPRRTHHFSFRWRRRTGFKFKLTRRPPTRPPVRPHTATPRRTQRRTQPTPLRHRSIQGPTMPRNATKTPRRPKPPTRTRPRALTTPKGCPVRPGTRWIRVSVLPPNITYTLRFFSKATPPTPTKHGWFCLGFAGTTQHTFHILSDGYRPCRLTLTPKQPLVQLVLRGDDPNSFEEEKRDYCRKP